MRRSEGFHRRRRRESSGFQLGVAKIRMLLEPAHRAKSIGVNVKRNSWRAEEVEASRRFRRRLGRHIPRSHIPKAELPKNDTNDRHARVLVNKLDTIEPIARRDPTKITEVSIRFAGLQSRRWTRSLDITLWRIRLIRKSAERSHSEFRWFG